MAFGANGCASDTASVQLTVVKSSGLRGLAGVERFEVYPNPVAAGTTVRVTVALTHASRLEVVDGLGRVVWTRAASAGTRGVLEVPVPSEVGVYTLRLTDGEAGLSRVLVVE